MCVHRCKHTHTHAHTHTHTHTYTHTHTHTHTHIHTQSIKYSDLATKLKHISIKVLHRLENSDFTYKFDLSSFGISSFHKSISIMHIMEINEVIYKKRYEKVRCFKNMVLLSTDNKYSVMIC